MQFEDFDKKIRDAAEHHHPAYNEGAWSMMEQQLDKHLPQEKNDRKRLIGLLLFFLLLGGGVWYFLEKQGNDQTASIDKTVATEPGKAGKNSNTNNTANTTTSNVPGNPEGASIGQKNPAEHLSPGSNEKAPSARNNNAGLPAKGEEISQVEQFSITTNEAAKKTRKQPKTDGVTNNPVNTDQNSSIFKTSPLVEKNNSLEKAATEQPVDIKKKTEPNPVVTNTADLIKSSDTKSNEQKTSAKKEVKEPETVTKTEVSNKKNPIKKSNSLEFTLSAGPDISSVGIDNLGKVKPLYGIGLSYNIKDRFSVRTGFYATDKVYTASPEDYKPGYPIPNFNYLNKVDADCKVFEIPLTVAYKFGMNKKHNWFAAAGVSSFIMKKEKYDYLYKYPNGSTYTYTRNVENENKHLFSVISLSGGYTQKLGSKFSLSAEPYIKLPTSGVGAGNIKLQSGGILFTLGARLTGNK